MAKRKGQVAVLSGREWLDENPEMMKQIPSEEERVGSIVARRSIGTFFRVLLIAIGSLPIPIFWGGRGDTPPIIELGIKGRIISFMFFWMMLLLVYFLGRHEKGRVDIYPNMFVLCDYDMDRQEPRPCQFYYWADIIQYHAAEPYLWLKTIDSDPVRFWGDMAKLRPYFEQYAPHAVVVRFSMDRYLEKRRKQKEKERKAEKKVARKAEKERKDKE